MSNIILPNDTTTTLEVKILNGMVVIHLSRVADTITLSPQGAAEVAREMSLCARELAIQRGLIKRSDVEIT